MSVGAYREKDLQTGRLDGPGANRLGSQIYSWEAHFLFRTETGKEGIDSPRVTYSFARGN